jgi:hypothetical protein
MDLSAPSSVWRTHAARLGLARSRFVRVQPGRGACSFRALSYGGVSHDAAALRAHVQKTYGASPGFADGGADALELGGRILLAHTFRTGAGPSAAAHLVALWPPCSTRSSSTSTHRAEVIVEACREGEQRSSPRPPLCGSLRTWVSSRLFIQETRVAGTPRALDGPFARSDQRGGLRANGPPRGSEGPWSRTSRGPYGSAGLVRTTAGEPRGAYSAAVSRQRAPTVEPQGESRSTRSTSKVLFSLLRSEVTLTLSPAFLPSRAL